MTMKLGKMRIKLLAATLLLTAGILAATGGCEQVTSLLPTPTILPPLTPEYYSSAQIAEHYRNCMSRIQPEHPDNSLSPAQLAERMTREELIEMDADCYERYAAIFSFPTREP